MTTSSCETAPYHLCPTRCSNHPNTFLFTVKSTYGVANEEKKKGLKNSLQVAEVYVSEKHFWKKSALLQPGPGIPCVCTCRLLTYCLDNRVVLFVGTVQAVDEMSLLPYFCSSKLVSVLGYCTGNAFKVRTLEPRWCFCLC